MKVIVIFGITSRICKHFVENKLLDSDYLIIGVGRSESFSIQGKNITYISGDIRDDALYEKLPRDKVFAIFNFSAVQPSILPEFQSENEEIHEYVDVNIIGTLKILDYCRSVGCDRYIFTDTHRVYENYWKSKHNLTPNLLANINVRGDHAMYALTKNFGSQMAEYFGHKYLFKIFIFRLPMIYSIPENEYYKVNGVDRTMPFLELIKKAINGDNLEIWGDPNLKRDYVYVQNSTQLFWKSLHSDCSGGTYNVGTGEGVSTEVFVKTIAKVFSPDFENQEFSYNPKVSTYKSAVYDISKEKAELDYAPILLKEMLEDMRYQLYSKNLVKEWNWLKPKNE
jgi:UDP-glucose 4-epimerase